uniref:Uncharacterized protein n=1 Tax=Micrurus surinamensis TaxID=129470 RepID=A0A2D4P1Y9_MICSU
MQVENSIYLRKFFWKWKKSNGHISFNPILLGHNLHHSIRLGLSFLNSQKVTSMSNQRIKQPSWLAIQPGYGHSLLLTKPKNLQNQSIQTLPYSSNLSQMTGRQCVTSKLGHKIVRATKSTNLSSTKLVPNDEDNPGQHKPAGSKNISALLHFQNQNLTDL